MLYKDIYVQEKQFKIKLLKTFKSMYIYVICIKFVCMIYKSNFFTNNFQTTSIISMCILSISADTFYRKINITRNNIPILFIRLHKIRFYFWDIGKKNMKITFVG